MNEIFTAFSRSLRGLFQPQVLLRLLLPWVVAFGLSLVLLILSWSTWFHGLFAWYQGGQIVSVMAWPFVGFWPAAPDFFSTIMAGVTLLVLFFVTVYIVSILFITNLIVPILVPLIAKQDYPQLKALGKSQILNSLSNSLVSLSKYGLAFALSLPLWFIPGMPFFLTVCLNGYLAAKIFPFDVLQDLSTDIEIKEIISQSWQRQWVAGLLTSMLFVIPVINFFAPVFMTLVFIHLNLEELQKKRKLSQSL